MLSNKVFSISVITSSTCNLNCDFCYLHKNKINYEYNELLRAAWDDGTYVNNLKLVFEKMENNPEDVKEIHFWGGETLIQIDLIEKNVSKIYKIFPNLKEWHMSTNWVIDIDKFFNFLKTVDLYAKPESKIEIQISIDGPPGACSENGHNGWNFYKNNFIKFFQLTNNYKFKNLFIQFHLKSTLSKELYLDLFSTYEGIRDYMVYMSTFLKEIDEYCISKSTHIRELFTLPTIANPHIYSKEEGQKIHDILIRWEEVLLREFNNDNIPFLYGLNEYNMDRIIFDSNIQCNEFLNRYTINFDGTIVECSGVFIDYYKPYQQELLNQGKQIEYEEALINAKNSINPILASPEEIKKWKWKMQTGYRDTYFTYLNLMMGVAEELCASRQIPSYYEDKTLLLKELSSFQNSNGCSKENFSTTRVPFLTSVGNIRQFFNGVMSYGSNKKNQELKNSFKYQQMNNNSKYKEQGMENSYEYNI